MPIDQNLNRILLALVLDVTNHPENLRYVNTYNEKFSNIYHKLQTMITITPDNDPRKDFLGNGQKIQSIFGELDSIELFEVIKFIMFPDKVNDDLKKAIFSTIQEMRKAP